MGVKTQNSTDNRVLRGGSWGSYPRDARAAYRYADVPYDVSSSLGFRVILAVPSS
jgi:formylglycine-generating enzyme required for sulfatase activity